MGTMKAAVLAPNAVLLPVDFDAVPLYSRRFKAAVAELAPVIEDRGIDEIYIDLTNVPGAQDRSARPLRRRARWRWRSRQRQASHRRPDLLDRRHAEQAAVARSLELDKPDGLTRADDGRDLPGAIWPLAAPQGQRHRPKAAASCRTRHPHRRRLWPVRAAPGSSSASARAYGAWLHDGRLGRDERPLVTDGEPVSMSQRDHLRAAICTRCATGPSSAPSSPELCEALRRRPATRKGYLEPDHRHQAALRRFQDRHRVDPDAAGAGQRLRRRSAAPPASA
jgi:DNA polymerase-4